MSSTGTGTSVFLYTFGAAGAAASKVTFTPGVGTRAIDIVVSDQTTGVEYTSEQFQVTQPTANSIVISNLMGSGASVRVWVKFLESSIILNQIATTDSRLVAGVSTAGSTDVQVFTTTGVNTWTKPPGAKWVQVMMAGGGAGGASGRKGASGTNRFGGGAGQGGGTAIHAWPASVLGATETVTVGAAGTGGAAQAGADSNGVDGVDGGDTSFGSWLKAAGGAKGTGGTAAAGTGGVSTSTKGPGAIWCSSFSGGVGSNGSALTPATPSTFNSLGSKGGAGGGGLDATDVANNGGTAASIALTLVLAGGTGGVAGGAVPVPGASAGANLVEASTGGGGGASSSTGNAQAGAVGGAYGGGGGGGGAAQNAAGNSGTGGAGADGIAVVMTFF